MTKAKRVSFIRGKRMRATLVDPNGRPVIGDGSVVTTKGFVSVQYTTLTEEGEAISITNANGDQCVGEPAVPSFTGFGVEVEFCDVDFAMLEMLTGQEVVVEGGQAVGITESTDVDISSVNFALEVWTGADAKGGSVGAGSQGQFGYVLTPFLSGGLISDVTIENAGVTFTITGMSTKNGTGWGKGPHAVQLVGGKAAVLAKALKANDHRRIQIVEIAPPEQYGGSTPLLDPGSSAVTAIAGAATGLSVVFTPTPAGSGGMFWDFGDGTWDYSASGGVTHVYASAGTYKVTGQRGLTSASTNVTTTA